MDISFVISYSNIPKLAENNVIPFHIFCVYWEQDDLTEVFSLLYSLKLFKMPLLFKCLAVLLEHWFIRGHCLLTLVLSHMPTTALNWVNQPMKDILLNLHQYPHSIWHPDPFPFPTAFISHFECHEIFSPITGIRCPDSIHAPNSLQLSKGLFYSGIFHYMVSKEGTIITDHIKYLI